MPVALPELGDIAAVLLLLLIAAALWVLAELIRQSFGRIPVVGSWITDHIVAALNDARDAILGAARATWDAGKRLIEWMQNWIWGRFIALVLFAQQAADTISHVVHVWVPAELNRVEATALGWANAAIGTAERYASAAVAVVETDVRRVEQLAVANFQQAVATAEQLYQRAVADIRSAIATAEQLAATEVVQLDQALTVRLDSIVQALDTDFARLESYAAALFAQAEADLTTGISTAEQLAFSQVAALRQAVYTDLDTWGDQAIQLAWPDWSGDIGALRNQLGLDFPWLRDLLGALGGLGAAGLAGALIRSLAGVHALTNLATDCIVPTCRNLSGLGSALSQLLSAGMDAALIAYVVEAIRDPVTTAADTYAVTGPLVADTIGGLEQLLGVKAA